MKTRTLVLALALVMGGALAVTADEAREKPSEAKSALIHVVIFRLKKDAPAETIDQVITDCHDMLSKIASVRHLRAGRPAEKGTPELAKKDYDLALVIVFDDEAGLKAYLDDPIHLEFVKKHGKNFDREKLEVFDIQDQKAAKK